MKDFVGIYKQIIASLSKILKVKFFTVNNSNTSFKLSSAYVG